jgi:glycosyltransferase involved in cell wall biosynthesis
MKLSIVIPYYNRRNLLINVLKSFTLRDDMEIIVIDDGSSPEHRVDDLGVRVIRLEKGDAWRGPCVAYNVGFKASTGDYIMINSSECIHVGDVIGYVFNNINPDTYMAFSTYMSRKTDRFGTLAGIKSRLSYTNFWGVHSSVGNFIPYCGVIAKDKMDILGGYDERFAIGIGFDDYDFTHRINNLGLKMVCIDDPFVVHQWHPPTKYTNTINYDLLMSLNENFPKRTRANEV